MDQSDTTRRTQDRADLTAADSSSSLDESQRDQVARQVWRQIVERTSTPRVEAGDGYSQVVQKMHPQWDEQSVDVEAHRIKRLCGNRDVLYVGERLPLISKEERQQLHAQQMAKYDRDNAPAPDYSAKTPLDEARPLPVSYRPSGSAPDFAARNSDYLPAPTRQSNLQFAAPNSDYLPAPGRQIDLPVPRADVTVPLINTPIAQPYYALPELPAATKPNPTSSAYRTEVLPLYTPAAPIDPLQTSPPIAVPRPGLPEPPLPPRVPPPDGPDPLFATPYTPPRPEQIPPIGSEPQPSQQPAMLRALEQLQRAHKGANDAFENELMRQGFIGRTFDSAKNNIGSSSEGRTTWDPRALWSHVFDSDLGSDATRKKLMDEQQRLDRLAEAARKNDPAQFASIYKEVTGKDFDPKVEGNDVLGKGVADGYRISQNNGVDTITNISAALASVATMRATGATNVLMTAVGRGALAGGLTKSMLMQSDGAYANFGRDAITGAIWGGTVPIGELTGAAASRYLGGRLGLAVTGDLLTTQIDTTSAGIGTRLLSAAAKSGTSGAVFGGIEAPSTETVERLRDGREITSGVLLERAATGAISGFAGGTVLHLAIDGVSAFRGPKPGEPPKPGDPGQPPKPDDPGQPPKPDDPGQPPKPGDPGEPPKPGDPGEPPKPGDPPKPPEEPPSPRVDAEATGSVSVDRAARMLGADPVEFAEKMAGDPYGALNDTIRLYEQHGANLKKFDARTGDPLLPTKFQEALSSTQSLDLLTLESPLSLTSKAKIVRLTDEFLSSARTSVNESVDRLKSDSNFQQVMKLRTEQLGPEAAQKLEGQFIADFERDLKLAMAVDQVRNPGMTAETAFTKNQATIENAYLNKASEYYQDLIDPERAIALKRMADQIQTKFNPESINRQQIAEIIDSFPEADRPLATAILQESAANSSDVLLKARLQSVYPDVTTPGMGFHLYDQAYTLTPSSSGNMLGYLFKKSNGTELKLRNFDQLIEDVQHGNRPSEIILFDDLSTTPITDAQREVLTQIPWVKVVDLNGWERGINVLDVAKGPQAVLSKLQNLVEQGRAVMQEQPGLAPAAAARELLSGSVEHAQHGLGVNIFLVRPPADLKIPTLPDAQSLAAMDPIESIYRTINAPKASPQDIADFLGQFTGQEREMAARLLNEGAVSNSFTSMIQRAQSLQNTVERQLADSGMSPDSLRIVSDRDPGGSSHMMSYLIGQSSGVPKTALISNLEAQRLAAGDEAARLALEYADDTVYSGTQMSHQLETSTTVPAFGKVFVATLGAYEKGLNRIGSTSVAQAGKVNIAYDNLYHPLYSANHPFFSQLSPSAQATAKFIGGPSGFGEIHGSLLWPHAVPDNNIDFLGQRFGSGVLRLPGP